MDFQQHIYNLCRQNLKDAVSTTSRTGTIVLPESSDSRILAAAARSADLGIVGEIIFIGDEQLSRRRATELGLLIPVNKGHFRGCKWLPLDLKIPGGPLSFEESGNIRPSGINMSKSAASSKTMADHSDRKADKFDQPNRSGSYDLEQSSIRQQALWQAATLVQRGVAQAGLAGVVAPTAEVIRAGLKVIGCAPGIKTISGAFFMHKHLASRENSGGRSLLNTLLFADAAVVVEPSEDQLVDIAAATVATWQRMVDQDPPKVAFLSFSTKGSARHQAAERTRGAAAQFKKRYPEIQSDGELQLDAALVPTIRRHKAPNSSLEGSANCLIFPSLEAGNIAYKITQQLGGYEAYGPLLQGLNSSFSDLSRGATVDDVVSSIGLALIQGRIQQG